MKRDRLTEIGRRASAGAMPAFVLVAAAGWAPLGTIGCGTNKAPEATTPNTGGAASAGGTVGTGGSARTGGAPGSGGLTASGGAVASGGTSASGGAPGNGGAPAASGGAAATGGRAAAGGATASGGATAAGGGRAGAGGRNGGASGTCITCQPTASCWSDAAGARCIERAVAVPGRFAIDLTEVTRAQYAAWLATGPSTTGQPAACVWNTTFAPDPTCMAKPSVCAGTSCANHPQPCVDFCDAAAYCQAIGRHLCKDEDWTNGCSSDGANPASYATSFAVDTCNDYTANRQTTVPVASKPGCQTPAQSHFPGVFDMIGNLAEWADNCTGSAGSSDVCKPRGLSFGNGAAAPLCQQSTYAARSDTLDNLGFRCCGP